MEAGVPPQPRQPEHLSLACLGKNGASRSELWGRPEAHLPFRSRGQCFLPKCRNSDLSCGRCPACSASKPLTLWKNLQVYTTGASLAALLIAAFLLFAIPQASSCARFSSSSFPVQLLPDIPTRGRTRRCTLHDRLLADPLLLSAGSPPNALQCNTYAQPSVHSKAPHENQHVQLLHTCPIRRRIVPSE